MLDVTDVVESLLFFISFFLFCVYSAICVHPCIKLLNIFKVYGLLKDFFFFFPPEGAHEECQKEVTVLCQFCSNLHCRPYKGIRRFLELSYSYYYFFMFEGKHRCQR